LGAVRAAAQRGRQLRFRSSSGSELEDRAGSRTQDASVGERVPVADRATTPLTGGHSRGRLVLHRAHDTGRGRSDVSLPCASSTAAQALAGSGWVPRAGAHRRMAVSVRPPVTWTVSFRYVVSFRDVEARAGADPPAAARAGAAAVSAPAMVSTAVSTAVTVMGGPCRPPDQLTLLSPGLEAVAADHRTPLKLIFHGFFRFSRLIATTVKSPMCVRW